jgi:hypothetical protein
VYLWAVCKDPKGAPPTLSEEELEHIAYEQGLAEVALKEADDWKWAEAQDDWRRSI